MRKIRNIIAGSMIAGALAAGAVAAPAAQAATAAPASASAATSAPAATAKGFTVHSGFDKGKRSLFKGVWFKKKGWYYVEGDLFDKDFDREYSYLWIKYQDRFGKIHIKRYKTFKTFHYEKRFFNAKHFWVGVSEGRHFRHDFSGYKRLW